MNGKKILLSLVLLDFLALTVWVVLDTGYFAAIDQLASTWVGMLAIFDLLISLTIATVWMWTDAKRHGVNPLPYLALTLVTGSAGPLLYVIRRPKSVL